ncbi:MAG: PASTA domain-containing protein [Treponema sp.]|nr:PASTA domain-containing protein [Treponema sp.]
MGLSSFEEYVANHLRMFILGVFGLVIIVGIVAVSVFFYAVRGAEQTMVPDVTGKELTEAMLELQAKELYPRLQLRSSHTSRDKGYILEQDPLPGTIVKAGRRIRLIVSQGVVLNRVDDFVGRNIDEVRFDLMAIQSTAGGFPLLSIKELQLDDHIYSPEKPGTILEQKPLPGTDITGPITMEFVVSRGRANQVVTVPQLTGLSLVRALDEIASSGINFQFNLRDKSDGESGETVVTQTPLANNTIPINSVVHITVTNPDRVSDNERAGLFKYSIPLCPYPIPMRLEAIVPSEENPRKLLTINYVGGEFTFPYKLPLGSVLVLSMMNRVLYRETIE